METILSRRNLIRRTCHFEAMSKVFMNSNDTDWNKSFSHIEHRIGAAAEICRFGSLPSQWVPVLAPSHLRRLRLH